MRNALEAHRQLPGGECQDADHHRRDDAGPGACAYPEDAPLLGEHRPRLGVGAVVGQRVGEGQIAHAAIASLKVPEATRQRCAYSAEVRNSASRGYGASLRRSAITRPGRAAITTMRCER